MLINRHVSILHNNMDSLEACCLMVQSDVSSGRELSVPLLSTAAVNAADSAD